MFLQTILPFVGILIGLIIVHEAGHFIAAKLTGVRVLEAGLGYPPRIWGKEFRGTIYSINALPLGGFCRMLGEEDPRHRDSLAAKPAWVRLIVLSAGSAMNFALPFVLFTISFMIPRDVSVGLTQIVQVMDDSPAQEAGLREGDVILAVNGHEVRNTQELGTRIRLNLGETITMLVKRESEFLEIPVYARWDPPKYYDEEEDKWLRQGPTGISITALYPGMTESESFPLWEAFPKSIDTTFQVLALARNEVISWFKGGGTPQVAGPVGIAQVTGEVVEEEGYRPLLDFAALLSINLAIINILPLPMLDGGRIMFVLLEIARRGKRVAPEKEALVHLIGLTLIIALAIVITYFDVLRVLQGESLFR
ncbi:MAG: M50 family metallopeptidase [Dehalococcoidia bacterium]